jgi:rod shape-determining protein MreD
MAFANVPDGNRGMARFLFALLLLSTALLQATFFPALNLLTVLPDFALVLLLIWSATHGVAEGMLWAFGLGIWLDVLTLEPLGNHALALLVVAILGGLTRGRLFRSGAILPLLAVIVATLAYNLVMLIMAAIGGSAGDAVSLIRLALMTALLNALLVPIAYGVLLVFDRWIPRHV